MAYLPDFLSPQYFYVVVTKHGLHVDMGYVPLTRAEELTARAIGAGCIITFIVPNNTCH
jgi:hypothetical protein